MVDGLEPGQTIYDGEVHGFGIRRGTKDRSYHLKYFAAGRQKWFTIGKHGSPWTPETARRRALELLLQIANGVDPNLEKKKAREKLTLSEFAVRYLRDHAEVRKSKKSIRLDRTNLRHHILPLLGNQYLNELSKAEICEFQTRIAQGRPGRRVVGKGMHVRGGPIVANRCLTLLSKMFALAEEWGLRAPQTNPARGVAKFRENRRERYLSEAEYARLGGALVAAEKEQQLNSFAVIAFRLLLLTGARLSEIQTLQWDYVDLERGLLLLPFTKTGQKAIRLSSPAIDVLRSAPRVIGNPYVVVGYGSTYLKNLQAPWSRVRIMAGLDDLRIHDLRHSFASVAAAKGKSLQIIGGLLNHSRTDSTERYAHLRPDDLAQASQQVGLEVAKLLSGQNL